MQSDGPQSIDPVVASIIASEAAALKEQGGRFFSDVRKHLSDTCVFPETSPSHVYHYTTIEGIVGLLTSRQLWTSDVAYLNDISEYTYADGAIAGVIAGLKPGDPDLTGLLSVLQNNPREFGFDVYASCFCEREDLLSQWRAYSGHGTGYALEFDWNLLRERFSGDSDIFCGRIEYEETSQKQLLHTLLTPLMPILQQDFTALATSKVDALAEESKSLTADERTHRFEIATADLLKEITRPVLTAAATSLLSFSIARAFLKSPTFSEEREWRVAVLKPRSAEGVAFRTSHDILVPYYPLELGAASELPIRRIIVGPGPHPAQAQDSMRRFLLGKGLSHIEVDASPIPLRV